MFDPETITVYQAYRPAIAKAAVDAGKFVPPFSLSRMTWIKPSFLWMMERSGWATKPGQEHVLAIRISRAGWEEALSLGRLSSDRAEAEIRVQWDPERDIRGRKLDHRSIQVGLGRTVVPRYVDEWTREIQDITKIVHHIGRLRKEGQWGKARDLLPDEKKYPVDPPSSIV